MKMSAQETFRQKQQRRFRQIKICTDKQRHKKRMKRWQKERQAAKEHTYGQQLEQIKPVCNQRCCFVECLVEVKLKSL
jgi:hypothetical protein